MYSSQDAEALLTQPSTDLETGLKSQWDSESAAAPWRRWWRFTVCRGRAVDGCLVTKVLKRPWEAVESSP